MKLSAMDRNSQFRGIVDYLSMERQAQQLTFLAKALYLVFPICGVLVDSSRVRFCSCCYNSVSLPWNCAFQLAGIYKNVVGTDASAEQLSFAEKLPNIRYQHTTPAMPIDELKANVAPHQSIDLVTVAQAFHWFDRPTFYQHVKLLLKRPNGVLAVWCYTLPRVEDSIDAILDRVYADADPFWAPPRKMVDDEYRTFEFPFEPVEGTEHTGPFEFEAEQSMNLDEYLTYIRSWSAYQIARQKGFELLTEKVIKEFRRAWGGEDEKHNTKVAKCPVFLRIGKVGK